MERNEPTLFIVPKKKRKPQEKVWRMEMIVKRGNAIIYKGLGKTRMMLMKRKKRVDGVEEEFHEDITHLAEQ